MTTFTIRHHTVYWYPSDATESFAEVRMIPKNTPNQRLIEHRFETDPIVPVSLHTDYYGNTTGSLSVPFRHQSFSVNSLCTVEVDEPCYPSLSQEVFLGEAIQVLRSQQRVEYYDFRAPTPLVPVDEVFLPVVRRIFKLGKPIVEALLELTAWVHDSFEFAPGTTDVSTTAAQVAVSKAGVCQDFSHYMLAVARMAGIPARYASGYIETAQAKDAAESGRPDLIGSAVTHAWVEALLPGQIWMGFDPTNNIVAGDRHVIVAHGRDYNDVTPIRGSYRGPENRTMQVSVRMERQTGQPHLQTGSQSQSQF